MWTAKTLIRLGGCPGWSESSLGAHSFCWFCHIAAHLYYALKSLWWYCVNFALQQFDFYWIKRCNILQYVYAFCYYEPPRDKTTKMTMRPAKTQISLGVRPVWSASSQCAQWVAKDRSFLRADSEDTDQTGRMPRLIRVFAGRKCHFAGFVMRGLIYMVQRL